MGLMIEIRKSNSRSRVVWLSCSLFSWSAISVPTQAELPVPMATFSSGGGTYSSDAGGAVGTIDQRLQREIFNWASFNVGSANQVIFKQPNGDAIALNRIFDANPSQILGKISANGSVYLINRNGIVFGDGISGGQVDVGARFLATTLDISDTSFLNSNLFQEVNKGRAALNPHVDGDGNVLASGNIEIKQNFGITTTEGGDILIIAPSVVNGGNLTTPGGNTVLAASEDRVYLTANTADTEGSNIGGILVEVDTGGSVENIGNIIAERGAVTLLGLAVNQNGLIRATTTVDNNGAIRLLARDRASIVASSTVANSPEVLGFDAAKEIPVNLAQARRTGTVTFGAGSVTEVIPDAPSIAGKQPVRAVADAQPQRASLVEVMGSTVAFKGGSTVRATGGEVRVNAVLGLLNGGPVNGERTRIHVDSGAVIDVSGVENVELAMSRNVIEAELRGIELADSPLQRDGVLRGEKVLVDARKGTQVANIDGYAALTERTVGERLSNGGTIRFYSDGDAVVNAGSTLDISGGSLRYQAGLLQTTKLLQNGRVVDISDADPNQPIDAILGTNATTDSRWGVTRVFNENSIFNLGTYVDAYTEGKAAGKVDISASTLILNGRIDAATITSAYQRSAATQPAGGTLQIDTRFVAQDVLFSGTQVGVDVALDETSSLLDEQGVSRPMQLVINDVQLNGSGVSTLTLTTTGTLTQAADSHIDLRAGGNSKFAVTASTIDIAGGIRVAGGGIELKTDSPLPDANDKRFDAGNYTIDVRDGATLDVAGIWVNDNPLLKPDTTAPIIKDGGKITLHARGDLNVAAGSELNADAGAYLSSSLAFSGGKGGAIALTTRRPDGSALVLDGDHHAYGFSKGGTLAIEANGIYVGNDAPANLPATTLVLAPELFAGSSYGSYQLNANLHDAVIGAGTTLRLQQQNRVPLGANEWIDSDFAQLIGLTPSNPDVGVMSTLVTKDAAERSATHFSLAAKQSSALLLGDAPLNQLPVSELRVESGAVIAADPGATVELTATKRIVLDGRVDARGGDVTLATAPLLADTREATRSGIWLGDQAAISVAATFVPQPNSLGIVDGKLFDAGSITLDARSGYVVAQTGSLLDVAGGDQRVVRAIVDPLFGTSFENIDYALGAGSINVSAAEGILFDSQLNTARSTLPSGAGASLGFTLQAPEGSSSVGNDGDFLLQIVEARQSVALDAAIGVDALDSGRAVISAELLNAANLDVLKLAVQNFKAFGSTAVKTAWGRVQVLDDVSLQSRSSLTLASANLDLQGHALTLSAQNVQIGVTDANLRAQASDTAGLAGLAQTTGSLDVRAGFIELVGNLAISGGQLLDFLSTGDMRARAVMHPTSGLPLASSTLTTDADIVLQSRQLYPTTLSEYRFDNSVGGSDASIRVEGVEGARQAPLSAAGRLTFNTGVFEQRGALVAPLGQITINAATSATLAAGSTTSVSAAGQTLPLGRVQGGDLQWLYPAGGAQALDTLPEKRVDITAPAVAFEQGATVNIAGGGKAYATEFTPGPGGTRDVLDPAYGDGSFAIIPGYVDGVAPFDALESAGTDIQTGATINLSGVPGLADGVYTVMPARYALMPGAYLVTPNASTGVVAPGTSLLRFDGSHLVAGKLGVAGTPVADSIWSGFVVAPGAIALTRSEYTFTDADTFFASRSLTPKDAGSMSVTATSALQLSGSIDSSSANGLGGRLDISADNLAVVAETGTESGFIELLDSALQGLGVDSLLIGGRRQTGDDGTAIDVRAQQVKLGAGATLTGPEIILAATDTITLAQGATLAGTGRETRQADSISTTGDGALVRVSSTAQADFQRSNSTGATPGNLVVAEGATLRADAAVLLDATGASTFAGAFDLTGGSLSLNANRIALGGVATVTDALYLSDAILSALDVDDLRINSRSGVDFYGSVDLDLQTLSLLALNVENRSGNAIDVAITAAKSAQLAGAIGTPAAGGAAVAGSRFAIDAGALQIGAGSVEADDETTGQLAVHGFENTTLRSAGDMTAQGSTALTVDGDLMLDTSRLLLGNAANLTVDVAGDIDVTNSGGVAANPGNTFAGRLSLSGESLRLATQILAAGGAIDLAARSGDLQLLDGALLDASGTQVMFADLTSVAVDGGIVSLRADAGQVAMNAAAAIDVSAGTGNGNGGALTLSAANGAADLRGDINAAGATGMQGGSFALDAREVDGAQLFPLLENAGFTRAVDIRQRSGDLQVAANERITSERIRLRTDSGDLTIDGVLTAIGDKAETLLAAGRDLLLGETAQLRVGSTGANHRGELELHALNGNMEARAGSAIDLSAADNEAENGRLTLWTPRTGNDVGITAFDATLAGVGRVDVVAAQDYSAAVADGVLNTADMAAMHASTTAYFNAAASGVAARLANLSAQSGYHFTPGSIYSAAGNLTITGPIDLSTYRYGTQGEAGRLLVNAAGNITLAGELSDGLVADMTVTGRIISGNNVGTESKIVQPGESWSLGLVAGRDAVSGWYGDTVAGIGDIRLNTNSRLRTGTGDIDLFAGNDLILADQTSTIYTVGRADYVLSINSITSSTVPRTLQPDTGVISPLELYVNPFPHRIAYADNGGDIAIAVGRDIVGADSNQLFSDWLHRAQGTLNGIDYNTWAVSSARFQQGVATLGGGNIDVSAGRDITSLSLSTPTTGKQIGSLAGSFDSAFEINGGGDIGVRAGGDINSLRLLVDRGVADVYAGGAVGAVANGFGALVALGDATASITASGDIAIAGVFNQTLVPQSILQNRGTTVSQKSYFFTYGDEAQIAAQSLSGDILLESVSESTAFKSKFANLRLTSDNASDLSAFQILPPSVTLQALQGDIGFSGSPLTLFPSAQGSLQLLAGGYINNVGTDTFTLRQSDADPALLANPQAPVTRLSTSVAGSISEIYDKLFDALADNPLTHALTPVHRGDSGRSIIAAGQSIGANENGIARRLVFELAQQTEVVAGVDISDATFTIQHNNVADHSRVDAGRDVIYTCTSCNDRGIFISGPGLLQVSAGRNIDLGASGGVVSIGNRDNLALPAEGADVRLLAGIAAGPEYAAFAQSYLGEPARFAEQFVHFLLWSAPDAVVFNLLQAETGTAFNDRDAAIAAIRTLPLDRVLTLAQTAFAQSPEFIRRDLILAAYMDEVRVGGVEEATGELSGAPGESGYARSFAAIEKLFPEAKTWLGDISLVFSTVQTQRGGNVEMLVPGGAVDVGLAGTFGGSTKDSGELGIMAQSYGSVRVLAHGDISVNASRIFALDAGDILLWSDLADIDAGRGAKTALKIPAPRRVLDPLTGQFKTELPAALSGSGIQAADNGITSIPARFAKLYANSDQTTWRFGEQTTPGATYLFAPKGTIDAGDAGIKTQGNLVLGAQQVIGADNISFGGISIGIPVSTSLGASLAGVGDAASSATESATSAMNNAIAETAAALAESGVAFVTVDIIGVGD